MAQFTRMVTPDAPLSCGPVVGQLVHASSPDGPVAYRCAEVTHDGHGHWSYLLIPVTGAQDGAVDGNG